MNQIQKAIQKFNKKYIGKQMIDHQKDAMENGLLWNAGTDHKKTAERLFKINKDLKLLSNDANIFAKCEMARKIVPRNLKLLARLKDLDKGGDELRDKEDIIELCSKISNILNVEQDIER